MQEVKAPNEYVLAGKVGVFLAGSIEMGVAVNWQERLAGELQDYENLVLLNPRRDNWDPSWLQDEHCAKFNEQVSWELEAQERADFVVMYFDPKTKSPVSLLELGLFHQKMIVLCPEGYFRKGNVDIVCKRYHVKMASSWENMVEMIRQEIETTESLKLRRIWSE